jgi:O-antigen/teichoic acid export membrane protein
MKAIDSKRQETWPPIEQQGPAVRPEPAVAEESPLLQPLSLRLNFSWTLFGNVAYAGCQWAMVTALAKLGTTGMVGQFALALALTAPVIMFANLQLRAVQATDARRDFGFGDYLALRLVTTLAAMLVIAGISVWGGYRPETTAVILIVGLAKSFEAFSDVFFGLLQQHERMDRIARRMILKGALGLALLTTGLLLTHRLIYGVAGLLAANVISFIAYDIRSGVLVLRGSGDGRGIRNVLDSIRPRWSVPTLKKLAWLALPLGFVMMLLSLNANVPRYFLERTLGEGELGIFAALAYLVVAGATITSALGQAAAPRLAKYYERKDAGRFTGLLSRMLGLGALMGAAAVVLALVGGRTLLKWLYRPEYAERADVLLWLMVAGGAQFLASFLGYGMTAARRFKAQFPLFVGVTAASIVMSWWLIPAYGLKGAALALLISAIIQVVGSAAVVRHALRALRIPRPEPVFAAEDEFQGG